MVISTQHDNAAVGNNDRMRERSVVNHTGGDPGQVLGMCTKRPDFRPQQPQTHLDQTMIEMDEHHIVSAGG